MALASPQAGPAAQPVERRKTKARKGHRNGGVVPFGYRRIHRSAESRYVLVADPEEGAVVVAIFSGYLRHGSLAKLVRSLTEQGIWTRDGKAWSRATVAFLLGNDVYLKKGTQAGLLAPQEALVAPIVFHKVQLLKRRNAKRAGQERSP